MTDVERNMEILRLDSALRDARKEADSLDARLRWAKFRAEKAEAQVLAQAIEVKALRQDLFAMLVHFAPTGTGPYKSKEPPAHGDFLADGSCPVVTQATKIYEAPSHAVELTEKYMALEKAAQKHLAKQTEGGRAMDEVLTPEELEIYYALAAIKQAREGRP